MGTVFLRRSVLILCFISLKLVDTVNLNVKFPFGLFDPFSRGRFTLEYSPAQGFPPPNSTVSLRQIQEGLVIAQVRAGSQYSLNLYFENQTYPRILVWYSNLYTPPEPPENLSTVVSTTSAKLVWTAPLYGGVSSYKLRVIPYSDVENSVQVIHIGAAHPPFILRDLVPGASYGLELFSQYENVSSEVAAGANITTVPNSPDRFIVWFRNQTTMLVLWQLPYPAGVFSHYRVTIDPPDAHDSVLLLEKSDGPSQAAFYGLQPGHPYNISIQTVSGSRVSVATQAQYRTIPLAPRNVTFDPTALGTGSFGVLWLPPLAATVFDRYVVSVGERKRWVERGAVTRLVFDTGLTPGATYPVEVQTVSGSVLSWPAKRNVTTRPLPVTDLTVMAAAGATGRECAADETAAECAAAATSSGETSVVVRWSGAAGSRQDRYRVWYHDQATVNDTVLSAAVSDSAVLVTPGQQLIISALLPGRNYSLSVQAVSQDVTGAAALAYHATRPSTPIIEHAQLTDSGLNLSWKSDVNSLQQQYQLVYTRNDTGLRRTLTTQLPVALLADLYPGAVYNIKIYSISNGVYSAPHEYYQTVAPNAARNLSVVSVSTDSLLLNWLPPLFSLYDGFVLEYSTGESTQQQQQQLLRLPSASREHRLTGLLPGWQYTVALFAYSSGGSSGATAEGGGGGSGSGGGGGGSGASSVAMVRSAEAVTVTVRIPPAEADVDGVRLLMDTHNASLVWSVPDGRADRYLIDWWPADDSSDRHQVALTSANLSAVSVAPLDTGGGGRRLVVAVTALRPGQRYVFEMFTVANGLESRRVQVANWTQPLVTSDVRLDRDRHAPGQLSVHYTATPASSSRFDTYQCRLEQVAPEQGPARGAAVGGAVWFQEQQRLAADPDRSFRFRDLVPGRLYRLGLWTQSEGVASERRWRHVRLFPAPVTHINSSRVATTELQLVWSEPAGDFDGFRVRYRAEPPSTATAAIDSLPTDARVVAASDSKLLQYHHDYQQQHQQQQQHEQVVVNSALTLQRLLPYRNYTITIHTLAGSRGAATAAAATGTAAAGGGDGGGERWLTESLPLTVVIATAESVPDRVPVFETVHRWPRQIRLRWSLPPEQRNGLLHSYTVTYGETDSKTVDTRSYGASVSEGLIDQLLPGQSYTFRIQARTRIGYGAPHVIQVATPIWPPPQPNARVFPTEVSKNATTIRIRFRRNYFSDKNGPVTGYSVVVAEDVSKDSSGLELPNWLDVQSYAVWPPFQVNLPYNPFSDNKSVEDFVIGTESGCGSRCGGQQAGRCYCNGLLRAGTSYRVKIRAFTGSDMFSDTAYSQPIHTEAGGAGARLLAVTVPLLLLLATAVAAVLAVALMRRRRLGPFRRGGGGGVGVKDLRRHHRDDDISMRGSIIETSRPVKLKDFIEHYRFMSADSDIRFSEEYEDLKHVGRDQPCTAADYPCNRPKNRFTNILPFDHSRYKLQPTDDEEGSDYINANYVPGYSSPREFIVTQGPLHSTRDDFWRMLWESGSRAIVMLTRCVEKGREKCDRYWPCDTQPQYYGDIQVQTLNQTHLANWAVSEFRVTRGHVSRVVRHFHFTTWPDFGVPEPPQVLVRFVRAFRDRVPYDQRPIITHCSAGVGRSGTFIALDRLLQHIRRFDYVDVFGLVYEMRKERVLMVQTEVQYICIYSSVKVVLEGKEDDDLMGGSTLTTGGGGGQMLLGGGSVTPGVGGLAGNGGGGVVSSRSLASMGVVGGGGDGHHVNVGFDDDEGIVESGM